MNIALTGGIGAGKSTVMSQIHGYPNANLYSFDKLMDDMWADEAWLSYVEKSYNTRDRKEISKMAFADETIRQDLMAKSSFKLGLRLGKILANGMLNFVEVPLLFEFGLQSEFDLTVLITADDEVRLKRAMKRDGKSREHVQAIMDKQMPEAEKAKLADIVFDTTNTRDTNALFSKITMYI